MLILLVVAFVFILFLLLILFSLCKCKQNFYEKYISDIQQEFFIEEYSHKK